jgi:hypothetical protein
VAFPPEAFLGDRSFDRNQSCGPSPRSERPEQDRETASRSTNQNQPYVTSKATRIESGSRGKMLVVASTGGNQKTAVQIRRQGPLPQRQRLRGADGEAAHGLRAGVVDVG